MTRTRPCPLLPLRQNRFAFERIHHLPCRAIFATHHHRRGPGNIGHSLVERRLQEKIVLPALVHQCLRRVARRDRIDHGRKLVEVEFYAAEEILGLRPRRRNAHGDGLADEADFVLRQRRIVRRLEARQSELRLDRPDVEVSANKD
jgi:hypothetical protein